MDLCTLFIVLLIVGVLASAAIRIWMLVYRPNLYRQMVEHEQREKERKAWEEQMEKERRQRYASLGVQIGRWFFGG